MELRARLDLEDRFLPVMQIGRREAEAPAVLVDHLGSSAGAGEETRIEMAELRHERPADDHTRRTLSQTVARGVQRVLAVELELRVGYRSRPTPAAGPGRGQPTTAERSPDATRGDRDDECEHREQRDGDDHRHDRRENQVAA